MLTKGLKSGFTLIELLVVIAIIGLLASTVLASLSSARASARDAGRLTALKQVQTALELYYNANGAYPVTGWRSQCADWGSYTNDQVIPGLVPTYMPSLPVDPDMTIDPVGTDTCCYLYASYNNGVDYKFMDYYCPKVLNQASKPTFLDPVHGLTWSVRTSGATW